MGIPGQGQLVAAALEVIAAASSGRGGSSRLQIQAQALRVAQCTPSCLVCRRCVVCAPAAGCWLLDER